MIECLCGQADKSYEYHAGDCPRFIEERTKIRLRRIERDVTEIVAKLADGETVGELAKQYGQPERVLERFEAKYQREIDEAKGGKGTLGRGTSG